MYSQITDSDAIAWFRNIKAQKYYVSSILKEYQFGDSVEEVTVLEEQEI